jgi:hypothetical protein
MIVVLTFCDQEPFTCEVELTEIENDNLMLQALSETEDLTHVVGRQLQRQMKFYNTGSGGYRFDLETPDNKYCGCFIASAEFDDQNLVTNMTIHFYKL